MTVVPLLDVGFCFIYTCSSLVVVIYIDEDYRLLNVLVKFLNFWNHIHCFYLIITLFTELYQWALCFEVVKKS